MLTRGLEQSNNFCKFKVTIEGQTADLTKMISAYEVRLDFFAPTDDFSITFTYDDKVLDNLYSLYDSTLPYREVFFELADRVIIRGYIDSQSIQENGFSVTIKGRDYRSLMVDAHIDPSKKVKQGAEIINTIIDIASPVGIIEVNQEYYTEYMRKISGVNDLTFTNLPSSVSEKMQSRTADPNGSIYQFVDNIVKNAGYVIRPTQYRGTIALSKPNFNSSTYYLITRKKNNSQNNNIMDSSISRDYSNLPTYSLITGRYGNSSGDSAAAVTEILTGVPGADFGASTILTQNSEIKKITENKIKVLRQKKTSEYENDGKIYKPMFVNSKNVKSGKEAEKALLRSYGDKFKSTLVVNYSMAGHIYGYGPKNTLLWCPDMIVRVDDYYGRIKEDMWIQDVTYSGDAGSGQQTSLTLIRKDSIVL